MFKSLNLKKVVRKSGDPTIESFWGIRFNDGGPMMTMIIAPAPKAD